MNDDRWQYLSQHLLEDSDLIAAHKGRLYVGSDGVTNALLILNNQTGEGILVNSEGSSYARYSAYLPFAKPYLDYELARIADYCVSEGAENTSDGLWAITFDEIHEQFDMDVSENSGIQEELLDLLRTRQEIAKIIATEDEFEIQYSLDICPPVPVLKEKYEEISQEDVDVAVAKHMLWVHDVPGGERADFSGKRLRDLDLSGYKLNSALFRDALLENCQFNSAELCFADFSGAVLKDCKLQYVSADELNLKSAFLENCDFSYLIGCHCNFADATFSECNLFNGKAMQCCFDNTTFYCTDLDDAEIDPGEGISERQWNEDNGITMEQTMQ